MEELMNTMYTYMMEFGLQAIAAVLVLLIGRWLAGRLSVLVESMMRRAKVDETLTSFVTRLSYVAMMVFVAIAALGQLGVQTASFIAVIGAAGLAVGFALQGTLANFASGVMLILFRPINAGDFINAGGETGKVQQIGIFNTTLNSPDNKRIIVPNSQILSGSITNFNVNGTRRVDMIMGISYDDDIAKAKEVMMNVMLKHPKIHADPAPMVAVNELADSSVNFVVRPWCDAADYWTVFYDCTEQMKIELEKAGISIPYPQTDLHLVQVPEDMAKIRMS